MKRTHPAWIEIDLGALVHNAQVLRRALPEGTRLGLLVKANAYGHGLEMGARAALEGGADQLVVASVDEGLTLRAAGIEAPILVAYPAQRADVLDAADAHLQLSVGSIESALGTLAAWRAGRQPGRRLVLHVEVDTGMGRGGVAPSDVVEVVQIIDTTPGTQLVGLWSHLSDGRNFETSDRQTDLFDSATGAIAATGRVTPARHFLATEALFAGTAPACDMVRIGLGFYGELGVGFTPAPAYAALAAELRPAMTVKARPVRIQPMPAGTAVGYGSEWAAPRDSVVATLPIGYADGWSRAYWPGASALLRGWRVPLIGRVSMDSVCADVTDVAAGTEVTADDEFVLVGSQGGERIRASELAILRSSVTNEVLTSFGGRLPRVYVDGDRTVAISRSGERLEWLDDAPGSHQRTFTVGSRSWPHHPQTC